MWARWSSTRTRRPPPRDLPRAQGECARRGDLGASRGSEAHPGEAEQLHERLGRPRLGARALLRGRPGARDRRPRRARHPVRHDQAQDRRRTRRTQRCARCRQSARDARVPSGPRRESAGPSAVRTRRTGCSIRSGRRRGRPFPSSCPMRRMRSRRSWKRTARGATALPRAPLSVLRRPEGCRRQSDLRWRRARASVTVPKIPAATPARQAARQQ